MRRSNRPDSACSGCDRLAGGRWAAMALPSFQQLMLPVLQCACQRLEEMAVGKLEDDVARLLNLSADELARILPSSQRTVISNRLNWARAYLGNAALLESPRRGYIRGTERARALLAEGVN